MRLSLALVLFLLSSCAELAGSNGDSGRTLQLLAPESSLHFISVKNNSIGEQHHFQSLSGHLTEGETASLQVNLASVQTGIEIRDQRMREHLFEVGKFATANVSTSLAEIDSQALQPGQSMLLEDVLFSISLHGQNQSKAADVKLTRSADGGLLVQSRQALMINAGEFDMLAGVAKLQELAGLESISSVVPVSFSLQFR